MDGQPDPGELDDLVARIERRVKKAIENAMTGWEKVAVKLGFKNPDDVVDHDVQLWPVLGLPLASQRFVVRYEHTDRFTTYPPVGSGSTPQPVIVEQVTAFDLDGRVQASTSASAPPWPGWRAGSPDRRDRLARHPGRRRDPAGRQIA